MTKIQKKLEKNPLEFDEFEVLLRHDIAILITGSNETYERIFSSLYSYDEASKTKEYLFTSASNVDYDNFMKGKITYRDILNASTLLVMCKYDQSAELTTIVETFLEVLEEENLPTTDSYFPYPIIEPQVTDSTSVFRSLIHLMGGAAENHKIKISKLPVFSEYIYHIFNCVSGCLPSDIKLENNLVATEGRSLAFEFQTEIKINDMYVTKEGLTEIITYFSDVVLKNFLDNPEISIEELFNKHRERIDELYSKIGYSFESNDSKTISNLIYSYNKAAAVLNEFNTSDFSELSFTINNGPELEVFSNISAIKKHVEKIEEMKLISTQYDETPSNWELYIISLNIESRKGKAILVADKTYKVNIEICGDWDLEKTIFTYGLHAGEQISVFGTALRDNKKIHKIRIEMDEKSARNLDYEIV